MLVRDLVKGELGCLVDMFTTAAHDTYVVDGPYGEVLIPAVEQFILDIDHEKGLMQVDLPEGLVAEVDDL
jgi:16S rRNA processing protein RimM